MNPKSLFEMLKDTFKEWSEDKASRLAAALAYYTVFSIAPLLVVVIGIAAFFFGRNVSQQQIMSQVQGLVGAQGAQLIATMIQNASKPSSSLPATVIGLATLLLGAAGLFGALQDSLNTIWGVAPNPKRGILGTIKDRFLSFTMVLGTGFLLLVSLSVSAALTAVGTYFGNKIAGFSTAWQGVDFLVSFAVITLLFAMIYKVLPDVEIAWSDVWIGAAVTALLFVIGKFLIGLYLGRGSVGSVYGAAGSLAILLIWVYYSAQILFFGAEFTQVYAHHRGSRIKPSADAILLTDEARTQQGIPTSGQVTAAAQQQAKPAAGPSKNGGEPTKNGGEHNGHAGSVQPEHVPGYYMGYGAAVVGFVVGMIVGARRNGE